MNPSCKFWIFVIAFATSVVFSADTKNSIKPASWEVFEKELLSIIPQGLSGSNYLTDYVFKVHAMRAIRDKGTPDLWMEMAAQGNLPLTATSGFLCMKERKSERAFEAALTVLSSGSLDISNAPGRLYFVLPAVEYLLLQKPTTHNLEIFTRFAQLESLTKGQALFVCASLSNRFVSEWIETMPITNANSHLIAFLADKAIAEREQSKKPLTERLLRLLNSFENFTDARGIVFVSYLDDNDPRLKAAMIRILKSEKVDDSDFYLPVHRHTEFIAKNIPFRELDLRPMRIALIERAINRNQFKAP